MVILKDVTLPTQGVKIEQNNVQAYHGNNCLGNGTINVSESELVWVNGSSKGISLSYRSIVLHAISTDTNNFPEEHIFVLVDAGKSGLELADEELNGMEEDDDDSEDGRSIELRFVPEDKDSISKLYHEICVCQELNPEEDESFSEDEGENFDHYDEIPQENGDQWYTAENMDNVELNEEGLANLQRIMAASQQGAGDHENDDDVEME